MERKMRVLMVLFNLAVANGVSSYVMNYFRTLNHDRVQMDFVIYSRAETPYEQEIKTGGGHIYLIPSIRNLRKHKMISEEIIREGHYDIVHDNILILSYFIMHYAKAYGVPVRILHSHSSKLSGSHIKAVRNRIFMPLLFHNANNFMACSKSAGKGMFDGKDFRIVPNVVPADKLSFNKDQRARIRSGLHVENKFIMGSVGRLAIEKNPLYAFKLALRVKELIPEFEYWWIGNGVLKSQAELFMKENHAESYIKLFGNRTDVPTLYQAMDMFFLPSHFEGLPVTALEAQASGLPCLVSDTVSDEFVYTDLVTFFSLNDDIHKITNIIRSLLSKKYDRSVYGQKLQESRFSDSNAGANLLQLYREMIEKENHN